MAAAPGGTAGPVINDNPELQSYYQSLESRVGYRLVLGGTRHFGYWYVCLLDFMSSYWDVHITPSAMGPVVVVRIARVAASYEHI